LNLQYEQSINYSYFFLIEEANASSSASLGKRDLPHFPQNSLIIGLKLVHFKSGHKIPGSLSFIDSFYSSFLGDFLCGILGVSHN